MPTKVFTNGCFDILHIGHIRLLQQAKELGDMLIVGVNTDDSVRRLKGGNRPINSEKDRVDLLMAIKYVDEVIIFNEDTPYKLIEIIKPDIIVKGGDYVPDEVVGRDLAKVVIIPFVDGHSTTSIIKKIRK